MNDRPEPSQPSEHPALSIASPEGGSGRPLRFDHHAMACTWEILILGESPGYAEQAARAAFDEVDRLERELSRFIAGSDIARINALSAGRSILVGVDAMECLELAVRLHEQTGGAFDVTVGGLLSVPGRRGEGNRGRSAEPTRSGLQPAHGLHHLRIDRARRLVGVAIDNMTLDLGGVGKGYAIDRAVELLREWSIASALVHSGQSTLYAIGSPPEQRGWRIGVRDPLDHGRTLTHVRLRDAALSGSGLRLHGRHIIDPRSGEPANMREGGWAKAPAAAVSDALSTTFMILSRQEVTAYCERHPEVTAWLYEPGDAVRGAVTAIGEALR
jgi:thiamine biosynthesis lipoprotein